MCTSCVSTQVTDHCAIDLDQAALETQLALKTEASFANARKIYNEGGHSKSYAEVMLASALASAVMKDDPITGKNAEGNEVIGKAYEAYAPGVSVIKVLYPTTDTQASECQVGGLVNTTMSGCFAETGNLTIGVGGNHTLAYTYNSTEDNNNGRTL